MTYTPPPPRELGRRTHAALLEIGYPADVARLDPETGLPQALEVVDPHDLWRARTIAGGAPLCYAHWLGTWRGKWQPGDPIPECDVHVPFLLIEDCGRALGRKRA